MLFRQLHWTSAKDIGYFLEGTPILPLANNLRHLTGGLLLECISPSTPTLFFSQHTLQVAEFVAVAETRDGAWSLRVCASRLAFQRASATEK